MNPKLTRRHAIATLAAALPGSAAAQTATPRIEASIVERNDSRVEQLLKQQNTANLDPNYGGYPDEYGIYQSGSAGAILETLAASFACPQSRFHKSKLLVERMKLAAEFLERRQSPDGNIPLLTTNFNSPPDTGFVVHNVATAAAISRQFPEVAAIPRKFLVNAGKGMAVGGIHTPNHRWVVCAALAQIHELYPDARYLRRIDQWLAEGIDIDPDGQYQERSVLVYNIVSNRAFIVMAEKLKRPELLEPVRRNLDSMLYLLNADGEVVSEISRRQDLNTRGDMRGYWFALQYMALKDRNGTLATLAREFTPRQATLATMLEYPQLNEALPPAKAVPADYEKRFEGLGVTRIRRGLTSATILDNNSRFFSVRRGDAVVQAVRFATSFFGEGQFLGAKAAKQPDGWSLGQSLEFGYYQPLARKVDVEEWGRSRRERQRTEVCRLQQSAFIKELPKGFAVRIQSKGTDGVPLAVEINLREGGVLTGVQKSPKYPDTWILTEGQASYKLGGNTIRFGPGTATHGWTQVRGSEPKLAGPSVYLTGATPFDHTITFEWD